jgi:hypothetical protein
MSKTPGVLGEDAREVRWDDGGETNRRQHPRDARLVRAEQHAAVWRAGPSHSVEHEARGLLNVIMLASHCLRRGTTTDEERRAWRDEIAGAVEQLERLHRQGTAGEFLAGSGSSTLRDLREHC